MRSRRSIRQGGLGDEIGLDELVEVQGEKATELDMRLSVADDAGLAPRVPEAAEHISQSFEWTGEAAGIGLVVVEEILARD